MNGDDSTISDLTLERYHLEELPEEEATRIRARLASDPALRGRLEALEASDAALHHSPFIPALIAALNDRPSTASSVWSRWLVVMPLAAVVLAMVLVWRPAARPGLADTSPQPSPAPTDADARVKGEPVSLMVFRRTDNGSETLSDGTPARAGDIVRLGYRSTGARYGVIVSIDGAGIVTRHLPVTGAAAARLDAGTPTLLNSAYELDSAPGWEQFFLVVGDTAFDVEAVMVAAQDAATGATTPPDTLALPAPLQQTSFLLRKVF